MSYTEYLRRKAASSPVILSTRPKLDASSYTSRVRLAASADFAADGQRYGSITNTHDPDSSGTSGQYIHAIASYKKGSGGRVPDASFFTAYSGGQAIGKEIQSGMPADRLLLNSNSAGSLSGCVTIAAPVPDRTASQFTNSIISCHQLKGEAHSTNATTHPGPPVFVDNTITHVKNYNLPQNKTKYQIAPDCTSCGGNPTGTGIACDICTAAANHTPSADMPHNTRWAPRPAKSAQPFIVTPSPSDARKVGAALRKIPYVENHRGNPNIGHIQYPKTPYQIPAGTAPHLKINESFHYPGTM
jgi:hypothetical protein